MHSPSHARMAGEGAATMADEMTRDEFSEYMAGFEQRIADRFGRTDRRLDGLDRRFDKVDGRLESMDGRLDSMDSRLDSMDGRLDSMDGRLDGHDRRFDTFETEMKQGLSELNGSVADLKQSMKVQFEETRKDIKFSLEAAQGLKEITETNFGAVIANQERDKRTLERALHDVRGRTENLENRAKPTRRRR